MAYIIYRQMNYFFLQCTYCVCKGPSACVCRASKTFHWLFHGAPDFSSIFRLPQSISIYQFLQSTDFINFMAHFKATHGPRKRRARQCRWAGIKRTCDGGNLTASNSRKQKTENAEESCLASETCQ